MEKIDIYTQPIIITFFKAPTKQGNDLYKMFQKEMDGYILRGHPVQLIEQKIYKMMPSIMACLDSDVVIFDGSIEENHEQYRAALELMKQLDHVLIVSRTRLPINFEGMRKGGAPGFIKTGTTEYSEKMSNKDILKWIIDILEHSSMELPRKLKLNLCADEYDKNRQLVLNVEGKMITDALKRINIDKKESVFVSYLSRYSKFYQGEHPKEPFVEELFETICQISKVSVEQIRYFPPGKISLEFMTGQRRFEIVSITEKFIRDCKAVWIYDTPDYTSSWWVYGEKISLLHIYGQAVDQCPDIYVIKPRKTKTGKWEFLLKSYITLEEKKAFLPKLTPFQQRELERLYINSNPESIGYEQVEKMRNLASLPEPFLKMYIGMDISFLSEITQMLFHCMDMDKQKQQEFFNNIQNVDLLIEAIQSYVYTREFWENHIIECPVCKAASNKEMNLEKYMYFKDSYFYQIVPSKYQTIIEDIKKNNIGKVKLPCAHTISVRMSGAYYRWWTVKSDVPTAPEGKLLEKVNLISFC